MARKPCLVDKAKALPRSKRGRQLWIRRLTKAEQTQIFDLWDAIEAGEVAPMSVRECYDVINSSIPLDVLAPEVGKTWKRYIDGQVSR